VHRSTVLRVLFDEKVFVRLGRQKSINTPKPERRSEFANIMKSIKRWLPVDRLKKLQAIGHFTDSGFPQALCWYHHCQFSHQTAIPPSI